jgi:hypothetical protein
MASHEVVSVSVPVDRIAAFYEWYGRWLADADTVGASPEPPVLGRWDPDGDVDLARRAWQGFPARARTLLGAMIDRPDHRFTGAELADLHDIPNGHFGVAGVWAWPGRQLRQLGRPLPFETEPNPAGGSWYWMRPAMARLFAEARRTAG